MLRVSLLVAVLSAGLVLPPGPPRAASQEQAQRPLKVQVNEVNLYATVRDKQHRIIPDLKQEDFRIFEDNQEQKLTSFSLETNLQLTLAMLLDTSGSVQRLLGAEQETGVRFLKRVMRKGDITMLITFDLDADMLADFTEDVSVLDRAIHRARINAAGPPVTPGTIPQRGAIGTVLYDAVYLACREKLSSEAGRKAIILLTDAEDNGSKIRLEGAIEAAQRADTVIHVLLQSDSGFGRTFGSGAGVANKMAGQTGGRMIEVSSEKKLEEAFDQISEELRSQYRLTYTPSNPAKDGKFRRIRVETRRSDTKVLARQGYYAPRE